LIARPFLKIDVWRLPAGGLAFLAALSKGANLAAAAEVVMAAAGLDLDANLALLMHPTSWSDSTQAESADLHHSMILEHVSIPKERDML
jgi:hypothetical protein